MAVTALKRRRTYAGEEDWFPLLDEVGHAALRRGLIAVGASTGVTPAIAGNLVWFIEDQRSLDRHLSADVGVKYRRILRDLDRDSVARAARTTPGQFNPARLAA